MAKERGRNKEFHPEEFLKNMPEGARTILDACYHILQTKGSRALSIGEIADEADMSKANVLYHFGNKKNLILTMIAGFMSTERDKETKRLAQLPEGEERLSAFFNLQKELIYDVPGTIFLAELMPRAFHRQEYAESMSAVQEEYLDEAKSAFQHDGSSLSQKDRDTAAYLSVATMLGLSLFYAVNKDKDQVEKALALAERSLGKEFAGEKASHFSLLGRRK